jgi:hypothetical protein
MKTNIIIIAAAMLFASCEKCAVCTRNWKYDSYYYQQNNPNTHFDSSTSTGKETFDICGSGDIDNAERPIKKHTESVFSTNSHGVKTYLVVDEVATCNCIIN